MKRPTIYLMISTVALVVGVVVIMRNFPSAPSDPPPARPSPSPVATTRGLVGVRSCSASACHGGTDLGASLSEATTWRALDPHARAYNTLLTKQSQTIAEHLWNGKTPAHEASLCLKCHVHPTYEQARPNFRKQDGVGCESCHGVAEQWLAPHYRAGWAPSLGMLDTKSLYGRANVCATCHVGTPDANVDHDLIAAGHPPLRFEFATYFANLPPHWDVARDRKANTPEHWPDFDAQAWIIGQLVTYAAACDLLAYRADPQSGKRWPEFAELNCFGCHRDLQDKRWRPGIAQLEKRRAGSLELSEWYAAMSAITSPKLIPRSTVDREEPAPWYIMKDRVVIGKKMKEIATRQRARAQNVEFGADQVELMQVIATHLGAAEHKLDGDFATQFYFALLAVRTTYKNDKLIDRLRREVAFPPGYNGPHNEMSSRP